MKKILESENEKKLRVCSRRRKKLEQNPVIQAARNIQTFRLSENNIGIFGKTSTTGKSILINSFLAQCVATTDGGETTQ